MLLGATVVAVLVRHSRFSVDALVGGPPRTLADAEAVCLLVAATLPSIVRSRLRSWERMNPRLGLRTRQVLLSITLLVPAPVIVWAARPYDADGPTWQQTAINLVALSAVAQCCAAISPALAAGAGLAGYGIVVAIEQRWPTSESVLHVLASTGRVQPAVWPTVALTLAAVLVAVLTVSLAPRQRVSVNRAGRLSLRARVASSKLSVRIRR